MAYANEGVIALCYRLQSEASCSMRSAVIPLLTISYAIPDASPSIQLRHTIRGARQTGRSASALKWELGMAEYVSTNMSAPSTLVFLPLRSIPHGTITEGTGLRMMISIIIENIYKHHAVYSNQTLVVAELDSCDLVPHISGDHTRAVVLLTGKPTGTHCSGRSISEYPLDSLDVLIVTGSPHLAVQYENRVKYAGVVFGTGFKSAADYLEQESHSAEIYVSYYDAFWWNREPPSL